MRKPRLLVIAAAFFLNAAALLSAQDVSVQADHKDGVYAVNEKVAWTVTVKDNGAAAVGEISYIVKAGGYKAIRAGKAALQDGQAVVDATGSTPGALLLEVQFGTNGHGLGGAVFDWQKIQPAAGPARCGGLARPVRPGARRLRGILEEQDRRTQRRAHGPRARKGGSRRRRGLLEDHDG